MNQPSVIAQIALKFRELADLVDQMHKPVSEAEMAKISEQVLAGGVAMTRRLFPAGLPASVCQAIRQQQNLDPRQPSESLDDSASSAEPTASQTVPNPVPVGEPNVSPPLPVPSGELATGPTPSSFGAKTYHIHLGPVYSSPELERIIALYEMPLQDLLDFVANYRRSKERP